MRRDVATALKKHRMGLPVTKARASRGVSAEQLHQAHEWIRTDEQGCQNDVARMGMSEAARYSVGLARDAIERGDRRWKGLTVGALRQAFAELGWRKKSSSA